jgi:hypothetical protein
MKCLRGQVFQVYPVYRQSAEASPSADEAARTLVPHLTFLLMWHITSCGRRPFRVGRSRVEFFPAPRKSSLLNDAGICMSHRKTPGRARMAAMSIKTPTTKPTISIARRPRSAGRFSCGRVPSPAATTGACFCNARHRHVPTAKAQTAPDRFSASSGTIATPAQIMSQKNVSAVSMQITKVPANAIPTFCHRSGRLIPEKADERQ